MKRNSATTDKHDKASSSGSSKAGDEPSNNMFVPTSLIMLPVTPIHGFQPAPIIGMQPLMGGFAEDIDRYHTSKFICSHCLCVADEFPLSVPITMSPPKPYEPRATYVGRDVVASGCILRYCYDSRQLFAKETAGMLLEMLETVYGYKGPTRLPWAPSKAELPPYAASKYRERQGGWNGFDFHKRHQLKLSAPDISKVRLVVDRQYLLITALRPKTRIVPPSSIAPFTSPSVAQVVSAPLDLPLLRAMLPEGFYLEGHTPQTPATLCPPFASCVPMPSSASSATMDTKHTKYSTRQPPPTPPPPPSTETAVVSNALAKALAQTSPAVITAARPIQPKKVEQKKKT